METRTNFDEQKYEVNKQLDIQVLCLLSEIELSYSVYQTSLSPKECLSIFALQDILKKTTEGEYQSYLDLVRDQNIAIANLIDGLSSHVFTRTKEIWDQIKQNLSKYIRSLNTYVPSSDQVIRQTLSHQCDDAAKKRKAGPNQKRKTYEDELVERLSNVNIDPKQEILTQEENMRRTRKRKAKVAPTFFTSKKPSKENIPDDLLRDRKIKKTTANSDIIAEMERLKF